MCTGQHGECLGLKGMNGGMNGDCLQELLDTGNA